MIFYELYSLARNSQGSGSTSPSHAFRNARVVINFERAVGLYHEESVQRLFLSARPLVMALNVYYGAAHFLVTAGVLMWMFLRHPDRYARWRWALACTTLLALVGFLAFPLMPPRLITADFGMGSYVDTLHTVGGLWNFEDGAIAKLSNQYAAMPSLHFAWSLWCCLALWPRLRSAWARVLAVGHPVITLVAIVATANHYWLDAAAGALTLLLGWMLGGVLATRASRVATSARMSLRRSSRPVPAAPPPGAPNDREPEGAGGQLRTDGPSSAAELGSSVPAGSTEPGSDVSPVPTGPGTKGSSGSAERPGQGSRAPTQPTTSHCDGTANGPSRLTQPATHAPSVSPGAGAGSDRGGGRT